MKFLETMFPEDKPLFAQIAIKYGYGDILDQMLEKACTKGEVIRDIRVVQAIWLVASIRCNSNYCFVFHSLIMNTLGVDPEDIQHIIRERKFPDSMGEFQQYNDLLSYAYFRKNIYINDDYSYIADEDLPFEVPLKHDLLAILLVSDMLLMLTVAFHSELNLDLETLFETFPTHNIVPDYIKYFAEQKGEMEGEGSPVFVICSYCKNIKNQKTEEWQPVEKLISLLPKNAQFSHGVCCTCKKELVFQEDCIE